MRQLDAEYRLEKNINIAMLYLEDDDAVSAETYIKKASSLIGACKVRTFRSPRNQAYLSTSQSIYSVYIVLI